MFLVGESEPKEELEESLSLYFLIISIFVNSSCLIFFLNKLDCSINFIYWL